MKYALTPTRTKDEHDARITDLNHQCLMIVILGKNPRRIGLAMQQEMDRCKEFGCWDSLKDVEAV